MQSPSNHANANSMSRETSSWSSIFRVRRTALLLVAVLATLFYLSLPRAREFALLGSHARSRCDPSAPKAHTENGTYCGVFSPEYDQEFFLGVPYAKPPVKDLRFRRPAHLDRTFSREKPATRYSSYCPGYGRDHAGQDVSEDCLYLNVVRPALHDGKGALPVAVWIHGGGFAMGSASDQKYNLSFIVQEGVKVGKPFIGVSINYRLAVWGFLGGNEVQKSGETNLGLRDQRLALHWVKDNIKGFGGDPKKVTIWGESAGGASVGFHLIAFGGRNDHLFRAAVMESGAPVLYAPIKDAATFEPLYKRLIMEVKCEEASDTLQCLRKLPFKTINNVFLQSWNPRWVPFIDGDMVRESASEQLASENIVRVPIIAGTNSDEGTSFAQRGLNSPTEFRNYVQSQVKHDLVQKILDAYPDDMCFGTPADLGCKRLGPPYGGQFRRAAAFKGDLSFIGPRRLTCETWARMGLSAYCYRFNAHAAGIPPEQGAPHFAEVAFVFANVLGLGYGASGADASILRMSPFKGKGIEHTHLAKLMARSWASFFVDMDPNSFRRGPHREIALAGIEQGVPLWPGYDASKRMQIVFDAVPGRAAGGTHVEPDTFREEGINIINGNDAGSGP